MMPGFGTPEFREELDRRMKARNAQLIEKYGPGQVLMEQCRICGWLEWRQSARELPPEVVIVPLDGAITSCPKCMEAAQRDPELVMWVLAVVGHTARRIDERLDRLEAMVKVTGTERGPA